MTSRKAALTSTLFAAFVLVACSGGTTATQQGTISVTFPSVHAAIASDEVELHVFDATDENTCLDLVQKRRTAQVLPPGIIDRTPIPTCDFLAGKGVPLDVGYGKRAFLVATRHAGKDILVGCTIQGVGDAPIAVDVPLTTINAMTQIPGKDADCVTLSMKCQGGCKATP
ncbi:MAG: hypothetical protein ABIP89_01150 [Polyangiaceae bacterium]